MIKKAKIALELSILKWYEIFYNQGFDDGSENCALCEEFINNDCIKCPVYEKTDRGGCGGTPYSDWKTHQEEAHFNRDGIYKVRCNECKIFALRELNFLISLREEE